MKRTARLEAEWPLNGPKGTSSKKKWRKNTPKKHSIVSWFQDPINYPTNSANQNVTIHILHEKPEELHLCFPHKARHINEVTDHWILSKTVKISNSAHSLSSRDISCNQMGQRAIIWTMNQTLIMDNSTSPHSTTWQSVLRLKAWSVTLKTVYTKTACSFSQPGKRAGMEFPYVNLAPPPPSFLTMAGTSQTPFAVPSEIRCFIIMPYIIPCAL